MLERALDGLQADPTALVVAHLGPAIADEHLGGQPVGDRFDRVARGEVDHAAANRGPFSGQRLDQPGDPSVAGEELGACAARAGESAPQGRRRDQARSARPRGVFQIGGHGLRQQEEPLHFDADAGRPVGLDPVDADAIPEGECMDDPRQGTARPQSVERPNRWPPARSSRPVPIGPPIRSTGTPAARSWSARPRATPRPSSVITIRPRAIRPSAITGQGGLDHFQKAPERRLDRACRCHWSRRSTLGSGGLSDPSARPLACSARLVIRSTITPSVRARAIASIISGESDRAFKLGNSSRSFPRISTRLIESIPRSASISRSSPRVSIG